MDGLEAFVGELKKETGFSYPCSLIGEVGSGICCARVNEKIEKNLISHESSKRRILGNRFCWRNWNTSQKSKGMNMTNHVAKRISFGVK